jgi:hypothetical protein
MAKSQDGSDRTKVIVAFIAAVSVIVAAVIGAPFFSDWVTGSEDSEAQVTAAVLPPTCTYSLGENMTIDYPSEWYVYDQYGTGWFSPQPGDPDNATPRPVFAVAYELDEHIIEVAGVNAQAVLAELSSEFELDLTDTPSPLNVNEVLWIRAAFRGPFGDFEETMQGWIAVHQRPTGFVFVLAASPVEVWSNYENIFEAMFQSVRFG